MNTDLNTDLNIDGYEIICESFQINIISNHCGHLRSKEEAVFCKDCNFMCCGDRCLTDGICNACMNSQNGENILSLDKNAMKCPDCKYMCRHLDSWKIEEHNSQSFCYNFLSLLCCFGCSMFQILGFSASTEGSDCSLKKDFYYKLRYHCRKCNKTFFENVNEIKSLNSN
jgi:hypothetical protein